MSRPDFALRRFSRIAVAVLLACGTVSLANADSDDTLGNSTTVTLPPQSNGKPPSWAGRAFRQGVVSVANPYGAEAGAQILEEGGNLAGIGRFDDPVSGESPAPSAADDAPLLRQPCQGTAYGRPGDSVLTYERGLTGQSLTRANIAFGQRL